MIIYNVFIIIILIYSNINWIIIITTTCVMVLFNWQSMLSKVIYLIILNTHKACNSKISNCYCNYNPCIKQFLNFKGTRCSKSFMHSLFRSFHVLTAQIIATYILWNHLILWGTNVFGFHRSPLPSNLHPPKLVSV